jgi:hypothetical protein
MPGTNPGQIPSGWNNIPGQSNLETASWNISASDGWKWLRCLLHVVGGMCTGRYTSLVMRSITSTCGLLSWKAGVAINGLNFAVGEDWVTCNLLIGPEGRKPFSTTSYLVVPLTFPGAASQGVWAGGIVPDCCQGSTRPSHLTNVLQESIWTLSSFYFSSLTHPQIFLWPSSLHHSNKLAKILSTTTTKSFLPGSTNSPWC